MMQSALLHTQNLRIGYKHYVVQDDLSLSLQAGELVCMLGKNGCGKSTLLRTLAGLQAPLGGQIYMQGQESNNISTRQRAQLFSLVLTDRVENSNMTVWDVVSLGRFPHNNWLGQLSENDKTLVNDAIRKVKLEGKKNAYIHCLSDGERQRVMIARALAQDTPLILMDEPTAHLDLPNRVDTMLLLRELAHATHKTILLSTHELDLALQTADKIWLMSPQTGIITGIPEDLVLEGAFQKAFEANSFIFNPANGNFSVSYETNKPLHIYGDRTRTYWTVRALARMGYAGVEVAENSVEILPDGWRLNHDTFCSSIEELSEKLDSIFG